MPNIVEQQDLLKGLPDSRLSTLMQNPVATIPPFLVAAEAQRRQAIRQQFAGSGSNESVVDSLTKQLANVPQNIQATPQPMPPVPPTPPMAGVAALQQGMAAGGPVRRFAEQGYVAPQFRGRAGAQGYLPGEQPEDSVLSRVYNYVTPGITTLLTNLQTMGINPNAEQKKQLNLQNNITEASQGPEYVDPFVAAGRPAERGIKPTIPPDPNAGKTDTSPENQTAAADDELRNRLEALYADQGVSDMEKAQKWFAMASQFYDPELTTGQSIARAGLAFTEAAGNQAQAEREARQAQAEALLKYDIGEQERLRAAAAEAAKIKAEREFKLLERSIPDASSAITAYTQAIRGIDSLLDDTYDPAEREKLLKEKRGYEIQLANIMKSGGFGAGSVKTVDELRALVSGQ